MAQPLWRNLAALTGSGPLLVLIDDGWPAAPTFEKRIAFARRQMEAAARAGRVVAVKAFSEAGLDIAPLNVGEIDGRLRTLAPAPYSPPRDAALPAIERFLTKSRRPTSCGSPTGSNSAAPAALLRGSRASPAPSTSSATGRARGPSRAPRTRRDRSRRGWCAPTPLRPGAASRERSTRRAARSGARRSTSAQTFRPTRNSICRSNCATRRRGRHRRRPVGWRDLARR